MNQEAMTAFCSRMVERYQRDGECPECGFATEEDTKGDRHHWECLFAAVLGETTEDISRQRTDSELLDWLLTQFQSYALEMNGTSLWRLPSYVGSCRAQNVRDSLEARREQEEMDRQSSCQASWHHLPAADVAGVMCGTCRSDHKSYVADLRRLSGLIQDVRAEDAHGSAEESNG